VTYAALLAHARGALYGTELGSVTLKRIGFFCFPIKYSTHTACTYKGQKCVSKPRLGVPWAIAYLRIPWSVVNSGPFFLPGEESHHEYKKIIFRRSKRQHIFSPLFFTSQES
jgi:hypothetical protein